MRISTIDFHRVLLAALLIAPIFLYAQTRRPLLDEETAGADSCLASNSVPALLTAGSTVTIQKTPGTAYWSTRFTPEQSGTYGIAVTLKAPDGWHADVLLDDRSVAGRQVALTAGTPLDLTVALTPAESKARYGEAIVTISDDSGTVAAEKFRLYAAGAEVILIQRDNDFTDPYNDFARALAQGSARWAIARRGDASLFDIRDYPVVVYQLGRNLLTEGEGAALKGYLDDGGSLLLTGDWIAWGLADPKARDRGYYGDTILLNDYLGAGYVALGTVFSVSGIDGDSVGGGLSFTLSHGYFPQRLTALPGARPALYYGASIDSVAGVRLQRERSRSIFLGFGIQRIADSTARAALLNRSIEWLRQRTSSTETPATRATIGDAAPNPASDVFELSIDLDRPARITATLHDMRGERVATLADGLATDERTRLRLDASSLPTGAYVLVARVGGVVRTQLVTITR